MLEGKAIYLFCFAQIIKELFLGPYCQKEIGINYFSQNNLKGGDLVANTYYSTEFKKMAVDLIKVSKQSTTKTAKDLNVPLKTLEKWITAHNKDNKIFDSDYITPQQEIQTLKKRISELETTNDILKKTLGFYIKKNQ